MVLCSMYSMLAASGVACGELLSPTAPGIPSSRLFSSIILINSENALYVYTRNKEMPIESEKNPGTGAA